jgi:flagellar basal-body rod modification protein FlgD
MPTLQPLSSLAATAASTAPAPGAASTTAAGATAAATSPDAAADRFLTLLVTQLRNQDPLNPLDNAQVTTQLAQLSTVTGINKLNDAVAALSASFQAGQYLQALGLVGHDVTVAGNQLALADGEARYGVAFAGAADHASVKITDASGKVVRTIELGAQSAGVANFTWDGKADDGSTCVDGTYTISVSASSGAQPVAADPLIIGRVSGIIPGDRGTLLQLGSLGIVDLAQVLQIN